MNPALLTAVLALTGMTGEAKAPPKPKTEVQLIERVLELTNREREREGLRPLKLQQNLSQAADWLARSMADRSYFDHTDHLGRSAAERAGEFGYLGWVALGENLAAGRREAEEVVSVWMDSAKHRQNILNPSFTEIGIGFAHNSSSRYARYWVQTFGAR
ncbi:MAG TPA: CAP domain-containing protein [Fimbriimonadaceae bacterium]|nr:CAP domain-containing protein [Fimbriimonadaceae bacterium]